MNLTQDDIDGFETTLKEAVDPQGNTMSDEQVNIMIALVQMLNTSDQITWDLEKCDMLIARVVNEITTNNGLNNINEVIINIANAANVPRGSGTILKVEWYRRVFLYCLGMGVSFVTLQAIAPGPVSLILDYSYSLFKTLLSQTINGSILTGPSIAAGAGQANPFSAGAFAAAAGNLAANAAALTLDATTSLVNVAFTACAQAVSSCAYLLGTASYAACVTASKLFARDTFVFAAEVATTAAAAKAGKSLYENAMGASDEAIAQYIDNGGPSRDFNAVKNGALQAYLSAGKGVFEAIETSFDNMSKINYNFYNASPEWVQNRFLAPLVNDIINEYLREAVMVGSQKYRTNLGMLISDLSAEPIYTFDDDYVQNTLMFKYNIPKDPSSRQYINFRALITLWILATVKPDIYRQHSLPGPRAKYDTKGKPKVFKVPHEAKPSFVRSISLTPNLEKSLNKSQRRKLASINSDSKPVMTRIKKVTFPADLIKAIERNEITMDYIIEKGLNEPLGMLSEEHRAQIISEFDNAKLRHYSEEKPTAGNYKNKEYNMNLVLKDVATLLHNLGYDVSKAVNRHVGGQKSMRHKKRPKRSTIRRKKGRRVGQKSLKGKKRRYTKKIR